MPATDYESKENYANDLYDAGMEYKSDDSAFDEYGDHPASANNSDTVDKQIVCELKECHEYWLRRAKLLTVTNKMALSACSCELIRLEVALHFDDLDDALSAVNNIISLEESKQSDVYEKLLRNLIAKLLQSRTACSKAVEKIGADRLAKICLEIHPNAIATNSGRLYLFARLALLNPSTLATTATNLWSDFLTCVRDFKYTTSSDSQFTITPYDLILLGVVPALIDANFGNLTPAITLDVYRRVLASTFMYSLGKIPADYFNFEIDNEPAGLMTPLMPETCWNNCAGFVANIYWRLGRGQVVNRQLLAEILCRNIFGPARLCANPCQIRRDFSFPRMTIELMHLNVADFDVNNDADVFHLLAFFVVAIISNIDRYTKRENRVSVLAPFHFCDISAKGTVEFWQNESIQLKENESAKPKNSLEITANPKADAFTMLTMLDAHFGLIDRVVPLFGELLGDTQRKALRLPTTILQAHMRQANYQIALTNFEKYEKFAADDVERELLDLQFLQICMAVERQYTKQKLCSCSCEDLLVLGASHFQRCLDIVKRLLRNSPGEVITSDTLSELLKISKKNHFLSISNDEIRSYAVLCVLQVLLCQIQRFQKESKDDNSNIPSLNEKIDLLNAFSLCTVQLLIDEPVCYPILQGLIESQNKWGKLDHPRLVNYLKSRTLYSYIFSYYDTVKLRITNEVDLWESGAQLFRRFRSGEVTPSTLDYAENFVRFIDNNSDAIANSFKT